MTPSLVEEIVGIFRILVGQYGPFFHTYTHYFAVTAVRYLGRLA
jgi:hypothetical protein